MFEKENEGANNTIKKQLLQLSDGEIKERVKSLYLYNFYKGKSTDLELAKLNNDLVLFGQNWKVNDDLGYTPTQCIINKAKPLLKKQSRWMFGKPPDITINADNSDDNAKKLCEDLRKYLENILNAKFWKETRQAFLESTIKKRVAVRIAANPNTKYLKVRYDSIDNVSYKEVDGVVTEIKYFSEDLGNATKIDDTKKLYYIYKYYYKEIEGEQGNELQYKASFSKLTYRGDNLSEPIEEEEVDYKKNNYELGFDNNKLPCWVIKNSPELNSQYGESDLEDLIDSQNEYNHKVSDYADAQKFQMFGSVAVVDGSEESVNKLMLAPGALHAIKTRDEIKDSKQAKIERQEYSLSCGEAVENRLKTLETDMKFMLDMPDIKDLTNIPSGKAMKYLYNDLVARCEEKWTDWEPYLLELIEYIVDISPQMKLDGWDSQFANLIGKCTISFKHNYPIPEDETDTKTLAMDEVATGVRSVKSYIRDITKEEDAEKAYQEIVEEAATKSDISLGVSQYTNSNEHTKDNISKVNEEGLNE
ncbi:phage portal protein [Clostridium sp. HBUAS56017]|uniref:phage portal protein n=1 Tax=Clostridium sp. HBUAS56017 TaxID=2571128 RepID=UPI0011774016|nr:phage portal protein [Clostridium sp. HBUAS56017]